MHTQTPVVYYRREVQPSAPPTLLLLNEILRKSLSKRGKNEKSTFYGLYAPALNFVETLLTNIQIKAYLKHSNVFS